MQYRTLGRTGLKVSALSFGASSLGGAFRTIDEGEGIRAVHAALEFGVNFIDTSPFYGVTKSETILGKALRGIPRDRYFIGTKVGQYDHGVFDFSAARVRRSLDESCARLGVDYIDVLQCHDVEFVGLDQIVRETLPALVQLRQEGRIGAVGLTGLPLKVFPAVIDRVPAGTVDVILSFCHYELSNDTTLETLLPYFAQRGNRRHQRRPDRHRTGLAERPAPLLASGLARDHRRLPPGGGVLPRPRRRHRQAGRPVRPRPPRHRDHGDRHGQPGEHAQERRLRGGTG